MASGWLKVFDWIVQVEAHVLLPDGCLVYEGWQFRPPFICMCCGIEVSAPQWAFGRACGRCDTGVCEVDMMRYDHPLPSFREGARGREAQMALFAEYVEAIPVSERPT